MHEPELDVAKLCAYEPGAVMGRMRLQVMAALTEPAPELSAGEREIAVLASALLRSTGTAQMKMQLTTDRFGLEPCGQDFPQGVELVGEEAWLDSYQCVLRARYSQSPSNTQD